MSLNQLDFQNGLPLKRLIPFLESEKSFGLNTYFLVTKLSGTKFVYPIIKTQRNIFPAITLGRALTNDLCISEENLSKVHLFFKKKGDEILMCDHFSIYGTWMNKEKLVSGKYYNLESPCELKIGNLETLVLSVDDLVLAF